MTSLFCPLQSTGRKAPIEQTTVKTGVKSDTFAARASMSLTERGLS